MPTLGDHVRILPRFARSANLERDSGQSQPLEGYVVTARALEAVKRILTVATTQQAGGAWSLTGPYGSGKSSLALLLDALLGPDGATRDAAIGLVEAADPDMADSVWMAHDNHGTQETGFHRGLVTASREPLNLTVLRGLHSAVVAAFGRIPSRRRFPAADALKTALSDAASDDPRRTGPSPAGLIEVAKCLANEWALFLGDRRIRKEPGSDRRQQRRGPLPASATRRSGARLRPPDFSDDTAAPFLRRLSVAHGRTAAPRVGQSSGAFRINGLRRIR